MPSAFALLCSLWLLRRSLALRSPLPSDLWREFGLRLSMFVVELCGARHHAQEVIGHGWRRRVGEASGESSGAFAECGGGCGGWWQIELRCAASRRGLQQRPHKRAA